VLLDFYAFGSDALEEVKKLTAAIGAGELRLFVNDHLVDEVARKSRNRAARFVQGLQ